MEIIAVVVGWLLGILSTPIVEWLKERRLRKQLRLGILTELSEVRVRLAMSVFTVSNRFGEVDGKLLDWFSAAIVEYQGMHPTPEIKKILDKHGTLTDEQLKQLYAATNTIPSFKKVRLPYLDSKIGALSLLEEPTQAILFEIRTKVDIVNEIIEDIQFYHKLTFDSSIVESNHEKVSGNLNDAIRQVGDQARGLVNRIFSVETLLTSLKKRTLLR